MALHKPKEIYNHQNQQELLLIDEVPVNNGGVEDKA